MKVEFAKDHGRVVFVFDGQWCLVGFDEIHDGESYIITMLPEQKTGVFASPTRGFWYSSLLLEKNEGDPRYLGLNHMGFHVFELVDINRGCFQEVPKGKEFPPEL